MNIIHQVTQAINKDETLVGVIIYDEQPSNPVHHWDLLGTMAVHPRHSHWAHESIDLDIPMGNNPAEHLRNFIKAKGYKQSEVIAYPITKYEHGVISLSLGDTRTCDFDSGIIGFIYADKDKIRKGFGVKRITAAIEEQVAEIFAGELETQSDYLNGEVFAYRIYQVNTDEFAKYGEHCLENSEILDSCCGYFGEQHAINEMNEVLAYQTTKAS